MTATPIDEFITLYQDLHTHPELSFQETRTSGIVAERLRALGFEVTTGVGRTGVVGVLSNGGGPVVMLRADMDALPVEEKTGLPYASTVRATGEDGTEVPVMHACGHDVHVTCLLAACDLLAAERSTWSGTVLAVFQPAEETVGGAKAMIEDGIFERFGTPVVVLGQHVAPLPAGAIGLRSGPTFAATDALRVVLHGRGAHGSRPEASVDPVVMAAATILRLQTVVSREVAATDTAVLTIGTVHAGIANNVIPDQAEIGINIRTFTDSVRATMLGAVERIVRGEAATAGAPTQPEIVTVMSAPAVVNDPDAVARTSAALATVAMVVDPGVVTGSEDVGMFATAAGAPCVYWLLGGADPAHFTAPPLSEAFMAQLREVPSNHSPLYAPAPVPTLAIGRDALVAAAREWLSTP
jgi:hippurate hydrolase